MSDQTTLKIFNSVKNEDYIIDHSKFDSLQYLDSIRSPDEIKFKRIDEVIVAFKKDMIEEDIKRREQRDQKSLLGIKFY